jgi:hypothetical protein
MAVKHHLASVDALVEDEEKYLKYRTSPGKHLMIEDSISLNSTIIKTIKSKIKILENMHDDN